MFNTLFEPLFDSDLADEMVNEYDRALRGEEPRDPHELRAVRDRRAKMLLVERLVDEWPETVAWIRERARRRAVLYTSPTPQAAAWDGLAPVEWSACGPLVEDTFVARWRHAVKSAVKTPRGWVVGIVREALSVPTVGRPASWFSQN